MRHSSKQLVTSFLSSASAKAPATCWPCEAVVAEFIEWVTQWLKVQLLESWLFCCAFNAGLAQRHNKTMLVSTVFYFVLGFFFQAGTPLSGACCFSKKSTVFFNHINNHFFICIYFMLISLKTGHIKNRNVYKSSSIQLWKKVEVSQKLLVNNMKVLLIMLEWMKHFAGSWGSCWTICRAKSSWINISGGTGVWEQASFVYSGIY